MIPPMNFSGGTAASSATGGNASQGLSSDAGSMNINYGSGVSQSGDGVSNTAIYVGLAIVGFVLWKRYK